MTLTQELVTQFDAVLDALHALLQPLETDTLVVIDGQPVQVPDNDAIIVGYSPERPAVEVLHDDEDLGGGESERLAISCLASTAAGDTTEASVAVIRARAAGLVRLVAATVAVDSTLGGVVSSASVGPVMAVDQAQTPSGPAVTVDFLIVTELL